MADETQFIDAENFSSKSDELTFRMIVLEHLRRILKLSSVEFKGGYWETRTRQIGSGVTQDRFYVADTREEYSNAVDVLYDILYPHFDKKMKEEGEKKDTELEQLYQDCLNKKEGKEVLDKHNYRDKKQIIKRKLFRDMNCFLYRVKYMEGKSFEVDV